MKKLEKSRAPGPAAKLGEPIAEKIKMIKPLVLKIWLAQISRV